jgi:hypothetical protein
MAQEPWESWWGRLCRSLDSELRTVSYCQAKGSHQRVLLELHNLLPILVLCGESVALTVQSCLNSHTTPKKSLKQCWK